MLFRWVPIIMIVSFSLCKLNVLGQLLAAINDDDDLNYYLSEMNQMDINEFVDLKGDFTLNFDKLVAYAADRRVGSLFNVPLPGKKSITNSPTVYQWRAINNQLYKAAIAANSTSPIIVGVDHVHGANYIYNATIFPQQISLAATYNTSVAFEVGKVTGFESRIAGITWVFSPSLNIALQPTSARVYETFGEDTNVVSQMGEAMIAGIQSDLYFNSNPFDPPHRGSKNAAACGKHFIGLVNTHTGRDRTSCTIPNNYLMQYHIPPFKHAIHPKEYSSSSVLSLMQAPVEVNGRPVVSSNFLLKFLLRDIMHFDGALVTDYNEVFNLNSFYHAAANDTDAVLRSFNNTSIDIAMVSAANADSNFTNITTELKNHVLAGRILYKRIVESATRVKKLKSGVGLISLSGAIRNSVPSEVYNINDFFGSPKNRDAALRAAKQSITLLQNNDSTLPLPRTLNSNVKLALVGEGCDSVPLMSGGRTITPQGSRDPNDFPYGKSIRTALQERYHNTTVKYAKGCSLSDDSLCTDEELRDVRLTVASADYVVACVGENPYAAQSGDIDDLTLPGQQITLINIINGSLRTGAKLIIVLIEGRPRILGNIPQLVNAILHAYLPGPAGGEAITAVLSGDYSPAGRLPITYPKHISNTPQHLNRKYSANKFNDYDVQWPVGYGLSYADIDATLTNVTWSQGWVFVNITVKNKSLFSTDYVVIIYATMEWRPITPEVAQVYAFRRINIPANSEMIVMFSRLDAPLYYDEYCCEASGGAPLTVSLVGTNSSITISTESSLSKFGCTVFAINYLQNTETPIPVTPVPTHRLPGSTSTFFISSVVCFGAGIVGTIIIVTWLRKKGNQQAGSLLAPSSI